MKTAKMSIHGLAKSFSPLTRVRLRGGHSTLLIGSCILALLLCLQSFNSAITFAQAPDRSKPPELGPPPSLKLQPIQHLVLSNGLPVVLMEKHDLPLVEIELQVKAGSAMDPSDKSGLASITAAMMEEGAGTRSALELADAIDFLGANISAFAGQHTSTVRLHTPLSKLDSALALFADVAMRPTFPKEELERQRKERLTTLLQWHDEPRSIASVLFSRTLFGEKHPYGKPTIGNEKTLRTFKVDDLKKFHSTYFKSNNATLIVVGDVTPSNIVSKLEAHFGTWKAGTIPSVSWSTVKQIEDRRVYLTDKPGAAQSEIRIGCIGVERMTGDYFPLLVMNTILGGSFTSRLNQNLREQHGYAYGASSRFDFRPLPGPFIAAAAVQTAVTDKSLIEFMKELNGILQPVTDDELTRAKNYLALGYPDNFQTIGQIAGQLSELVVYNLPDEYFNNYIQQVNAVTKEDVQRVAQKYFDPEKVAIIVVGDRKQIEKGVSGLKLGPMKHLTITDVLGKAPKVQEDRRLENNNIF
ncbi:MAG: insulinase family protein [Ignavibacteriae bacterium]|nr:insulinase family protein [Ignavibacteriota bacterium]